MSSAIGLDPTRLLAAWEDAGRRRPPWRQLAMAAAFLGEPVETLREITPGRLEAALLDFYEAAFGPTLDGTVRCEACGEWLEVSVEIPAIRIGSAAGPPELLAKLGRYEVCCRLPQVADLAQLAAATDVAEGRRLLLQRCLRWARRDGRAVPEGALPERVVRLVSARMAEADPQADLALEVLCAACGSRGQALLDVGLLAWHKLNAWAQRLLLQVHILAAAYGWREADILELSPARRRTYLELAQA